MVAAVGVDVAVTVDAENHLVGVLDLEDVARGRAAGNQRQPSPGAFEQPANPP